MEERGIFQLEHFSVFSFEKYFWGIRYQNQCFLKISGENFAASARF